MKFCVISGEWMGRKEIFIHWCRWGHDIEWEGSGKGNDNGHNNFQADLCDAQNNNKTFIMVLIRMCVQILENKQSWIPNNTIL